MLTRRDFGKAVAGGLLGLGLGRLLGKEVKWTQKFASLSKIPHELERFGSPAAKALIDDDTVGHCERQLNLKMKKWNWVQHFPDQPGYWYKPLRTGKVTRRRVYCGDSAFCDDCTHYQTIVETEGVRLG